jgi:hypothetical protein
LPRRPGELGGHYQVDDVGLTFATARWHPSAEDLHPSERAGFPHPQWHKALSRAIRQRIDADVALRDFYEKPEPLTDEWLARRQQLLKRSGEMHQRRRAALAGDRRVIEELLAEIDAEAKRDRGSPE